MLSLTCCESETEIQTCWGLKPGCYWMQFQAWFGSISSCCSSLQRQMQLSQNHSQGPHFQVDFAKTEILGEIFYLQAVHTDIASHGTPCAKLFYRLKLHCCQIAFVRSTRNVFWSPKFLCAWDHKAVSLLNLQSHIFIYIYVYVWTTDFLFVPHILSLPVHSTKSTSKMCQHYLLQDHLRHMLRDL